MLVSSVSYLSLYVYRIFQCSVGFFPFFHRFFPLAFFLLLQSFLCLVMQLPLPCGRNTVCVPCLASSLLWLWLFLFSICQSNAVLNADRTFLSLSAIITSFDVDSPSPTSVFQFSSTAGFMVLHLDWFGFV